MTKIDRDLFELAQLADGSTFTVSGNLVKGCKRFTTSSDGYIYFENDPVKGSFEMVNNDENIMKAFAWLYDDEVEIETTESTSFYVTYEEPLKNRCFSEKQMHEVYRDMANKTEYPSFDIWFTDMLRSGVFERVTITAHTYVCELPETIQNQIFHECKETFQSLAYPVNINEQLENVKGCKMCDLEDTINVQKYYTR